MAADSCSSLCCFNPRPRAGSDQGMPSPHRSRAVVSIRAPARGATTYRTRERTRNSGFNPRPRAGSDARPSCRRWPRCWFQSAPPRGERLPLVSALAASLLFQSAPPRGERRERRLQCLFDGRFQSAPPRGERPSMRDFATSGMCFNPRPRAGSDVEPAASAAAQLVSIRAPARGATGGNPKAAHQGEVFQSAPPRGERRGLPPLCRWRSPVSIRAPARGATGGRSCDDPQLRVSIRAPARGATTSSC